MSDVRELQVEYVAPEKLRPADYNPRKISAEALEKLKRGIEAYGIVDPIIVRAEDSLVIGGHQRLRAAQELGLNAVPVVRLEGLDDQETAALNVLLNNPKAQGEWDFSTLGEVLGELDAFGFDATLTGFDQGDLEKVLVAGDKDIDPARYDGEDRYQEQYGVIVACEDEPHQERVYNELREKGYDCKVVVT